MENTANGPISFIEQDHTGSISVIPENQTVQFASPEKDTEETDALLTPRY